MPKKDFSASPLMQFIPPAPAAEPAKKRHETPPKMPPQMPRCLELEDAEPEDQTYTRHYAEKNWAEPRTRRVQLLMRPSVYTGIQAIADQQKTSFNHLVETVLADFIAKTQNEQARRERLAKREQGKG